MNLFLWPFEATRHITSSFVHLEGAHRRVSKQSLKATMVHKEVWFVDVKSRH